MIPQPIQFTLFMGFAALLFLLRVDCRRFRAAEGDDESGDRRAWVARAAWLLAGLGLVLLVFAFHPRPVTLLHLDLGSDRLAAIALGLLYGLVGAGVAVLFARLRYGALRLPPPGRYPAAAAMALGIAIIDEVLFRGVVLGALLSLQLPPAVAVVLAALAYAATLRGAGGGQGAAIILMNLGIGLVSGTLVLLTDGVGAGIVGLAITRLALFAATGRRGRSVPPRFEVLLPDGSVARPPDGWSFAPGSRSAAPGGGHRHR